MSCVAALVEGGRIYVATDSFLGNDYRQFPRNRADAKAFRHASGMFIGSCGTSAATRRLRALTPPTMAGIDDLDAYVIDVLGPAIATCVGERDNFEYILGIDGRLFQGFGNGVAIEVIEGFTAIGSGGPYALGSLATPGKLGPAARVRRAVTIAERYTPTVCGPILSFSGAARAKIPGRAVPLKLASHWRNLDAGVKVLDGGAAKAA